MSVIATFLALVLGGLALGLLLEGRAARTALVRHEDGAQAMELAETAIVRAEMELRALKDLGTDGIGTVSGSLAAGTYSATAVQDAVYKNRWTITAAGRCRTSVRRLGAGVRRMTGGMFAEGLFSKDGLTLDGANRTDSYDSRLGSYDSQAVNNDSGGRYAQSEGHIGSNGAILLDGSSITVRGNAVPGPGEVVETQGSPTVTADSIPRLEDVVLPATPLAEFEAALAVNDNGNWTKSKGEVTYDPARYTLRLGSNAHLVLPGGTYFLTSLSIVGSATIEVRGPTRLYTTGTIDLSGGTILNETGQPKDFLIFAHPYALPADNPPTETSVTLSGGSQAAFAVYAPEADVKVSGGSDVFGAIAAKSVTVSGNTYFHYDKGLGDLTSGRTSVFERLYWRDLAPPRR